MYDTNAVDVSVIIATRNRSDLLEASLNSLAQIDTASLVWEVVVVDNASTDNTARVLDEAAQTLPLRVLSAPTPGKTRAQNVAVAEARGALIMFSDDDVLFDESWLIELTNAASRWPNAAIFGGRIEITLPTTLPNWLSHASARSVLERHFAHYAPRTEEGPTTQAPLGPNMAIRRALFDDGLRFDEHVGPDGTGNYIKGGDTDLSYDLAKRGHHCIYVPSALISHRVRPAQTELKFILGGIFRRGRKNAYLNPRRAHHMIAGAPLSLWLGLSRQWLRYIVCLPLGEHARYRAGSKLFFRRGYLHQYRRQAVPVEFDTE